jgi:general stress protein 26
MDTFQNPTRKLAELIKDIRIAMLTTIDDHGTLRSRPMAAQQVEFDGDLWFFTRARGGKSDEIGHDHRVNVSFAEPGKSRFVSVTGYGFLVRDEDKMRGLWSPLYRAYFPDGLDDPDLALLKVDVERAEFWDGPSGVVVHLFGFAKSVFNGGKKPAAADIGRHEKLELGGLHS